MSGKLLRISRIFNPATGRTVIIPVDHGSILGAVRGLEDPIGTLRRLIEIGIDGTLLMPGVAKITDELFGRKDAPARILMADYPILSTVPGRNDGASHNEVLATVDFVLRHHIEAMKVILAWGLERQEQLQNIKLVADLAESCDRWNIPLMVEPLLWGDQIPDEKKNDPELVEHACRIALEIGADVLKIPYTGEISGFSDLLRRMRVPVIVLGGPTMGTVGEVLQVAADSIRAGAKGIAFGRNVWQNPAMEQVVHALQDVVHHQISVEDALKKNRLS